MHRARHSFATDLRRVAGIDAASHALGHSDLSTTLNIYGHRDVSDLDRDMDDFARWRESTSGESFLLRTPGNGLKRSVMEAAGIEPASPVRCGAFGRGPGFTRRLAGGVRRGAVSRS